MPEPVQQAEIPVNLALCRFLVRLRPAPLGSLLKRLLGIRRRIVATPAGRFCIDPASDFGFRLLTDGAYEPELTAAFRSLLAPGRTCVDIGANEGWFSVLAAGLTGEADRVVAVEPQARLQPVLAANFALNGLDRIRLEAAAVSDRKGEASFFLAPDTNTGASALSCCTRYRLPSQRVRTCTLAELLDKHNLDKVDLLKMDIEGHEHEAILGSPEVFTRGRVRHLALEVHPHLLHQRGRHPGAVQAFLEDSGYAFHPDFHGLVYSKT